MDNFIKSMIANDPKLQRIVKDSFFEAPLYDQYGKPIDSSAADTTAPPMSPAPAEEKTVEAGKNTVDLLWGAVLKAITETKVTENMGAEVLNVFKNDPIRAKILQQARDTALRQAEDGERTFVDVKGKPMSAEQYASLDSLAKEREVKLAFRKYIDAGMNKAIDERGKDTRTFIDKFMKQALEYSEYQIATAAKIWQTDFSDDIAKQRLEAFLNDVGKEYPNEAKHLQDILLAGMELSQAEQGGIDNFVKLLQSLQSENASNYNKITAAAFKIVSPNAAGKVIEAELQKVKSELGAQTEKANGEHMSAIGGMAANGITESKQNIQAVQNTIGTFVLYSFLAVALGTISAEAQKPDSAVESYNRHASLMNNMINLYNEEDVAGNITKAIARARMKTFYKLGKKYSSFTQAVSSDAQYRSILNIILQDTGNLKEVITILQSQGLIDEQTVTDTLSKDLLKKNIVTAETNTAGQLRTNLSNAKVIYSIIKSIYEKAGVKQTKAAAVGTAIGGMLGKLAAFKDKTVGEYKAGQTPIDSSKFFKGENV